MSTKRVPFLKQHYAEQIVPALIKSRGYKNKHEVPKFTKVSLNVGIDSEADKNQITDIQRDLSAIAGQKAVLAKAKKAISNFKLRQGQDRRRPRHPPRRRHVGIPLSPHRS